jgi:hemerythrin-like domain-containing protein
MTTARDAIAILKTDHDEVEQLFKRFEQLGPRAKKTKADIAERVITALSQHAVIEEQVLYPAVRERMSDEEDTVLEALEEHHVVKWVLSELDGMTPDHERFDAKFTVLAESVRHHVEEEEGELFPKMRKGFSRSELQELGDALTTARKSAPTKPHPRSPDEPPGNILAAAATLPLDMARSAGETAVRRVKAAARGR